MVYILGVLDIVSCKDMTKVSYFFRTPILGAFSIEQIFNSLSAKINEIDPENNITNHYVPKTSESLINIWKNIVFARLYQSPINHITGDIHYVILGLKKRNLNILTIHDCRFIYRYPKWSPKHWILRWLWLTWPVKKANIITVISEKTRHDVIRFTRCSPQKVILIPNFINPCFVHKPYQFNRETPKILHIGVTPNKNLKRIIQALEGITCTFEIVGNISQEYIELLNKHKINWSNSYNLTINQIVDKYCQCDLVVFASTFEGFGMPIIEAHQVGRPIVTSNISPMVDIAGDAACFVDPFDIESIRNGIKRVIEDGDFRNKMILNGLKNAQKFNLQTVAMQYAKLYSSIKQDKTS